MNISEEDYLTITNRVKITLAIHVIKDIRPGEDDITTKEGQNQILNILYAWEDALFAKTGARMNASLK